MCYMNKFFKQNTPTGVYCSLPGHLHVQVQYSADTGHAFVISNNLPLKKWIQIVMSVDDTTFYITTRQYNGPVFDKEENALHNQ